jgi:hypothetical protein
MHVRRASHGSVRPLNCGVMRFSSQVAALVSVALAGCVPLPHREVLAPPIDGTLQSGGTALEGVSVRYGYKRAGLNSPDCASSDVATVTDENGAFAFQRGTKMRFFIVLGDPIFRYDVCAERDGMMVLLWSGLDTGVVDEAPLQMSCDIMQPVQDNGFGRGRCYVTVARPVG